MTIKKILSHKDKESVNRLLSMFNQMEKNPKEVNLASFENNEEVTYNEGMLKQKVQFSRNWLIKQLNTISNGKNR